MIYVYIHTVKLFLLHDDFNKKDYYKKNIRHTLDHDTCAHIPYIKGIKVSKGIKFTFKTTQGLILNSIALGATLHSKCLRTL